MFDQRYWDCQDYWDSAQGPVFLFICGEGTCHPPTTRGFPVQVAKTLKARFLVLEHRYYGSSQPFADWSTQNLAYLNLTQALDDLDYFISENNKDMNTKFTRTDVKWLTIGGSYPGAMSAWFLNAYMSSVTAAWSSSGVINPIVNFTDFDMDIYTATSRSGPDCPSIIKSITDYIDTAVGDPTNHQDDYDYIKSVFGDTGNYFDFMFYIADIFTLGVQYGKRSTVCDWIISLKGTDIK